MMENRHAIAVHYDHLIELENDPVCDLPPLREYMDKWDGEVFFERMALNEHSSVLEIGVGTGRLAVRAANLCGRFCGIDLSEKTVARAWKHLAEHKNMQLICADFLDWQFEERFDVIYSSLTFMHIKEKRAAVEKIAGLLKPEGRAVISLDKNRSEEIDAGFGKIGIWPDDPIEIAGLFKQCGMESVLIDETEFAFIVTAIMK